MKNIKSNYKYFMINNYYDLCDFLSYKCGNLENIEIKVKKNKKPYIQFILRDNIIQFVKVKIEIDDLNKVKNQLKSLDFKYYNYHNSLNKSVNLFYEDNFDDYIIDIYPKVIGFDYKCLGSRLIMRFSRSEKLVLKLTKKTKIHISRRDFLNNI